MIKTLIVIIPLLLFSFLSLGKTIHVGIESFPPLITDDAQGYVIDMLKKLEEKTDFKFEFHTMTYARAKIELKKQSLDMIALTPKGNEVASFYQYGEDLEWGVNANVDLFALKKSALEIKNLPLHSIGTLRGNADFFAELLNIPRQKFVEVGSLKQVVKMLDLKRLDAAIFERASMIDTINRLGIANVFYKNLITIQAGIAVQKNENGTKLKKQMDVLLSKIKYQQQFTLYFQYERLPNYGKITKNMMKNIKNH